MVFDNNKEKQPVPFRDHIPTLYLFRVTYVIDKTRWMKTGPLSAYIFIYKEQIRTIHKWGYMLIIILGCNQNYNYLHTIK